MQQVYVPVNFIHVSQSTLPPLKTNAVVNVDTSLESRVKCVCICVCGWVCGMGSLLQTLLSKGESQSLTGMYVCDVCLSVC